ncbi:MAG: hypothetical protein HFK04_04935 [Oscillospiraceae bacterium]|nr:hypothetical protein [Oscillospiraceae bacterium]
MERKPTRQPCVAHVTADQKSLADVKGYAADFNQLPEPVQRLLVRLALGPVRRETLEKEAGNRAL